MLGGAAGEVWTARTPRRGERGGPWRTVADRGGPWRTLWRGGVGRRCEGVGHRKTTSCFNHVRNIFHLGSSLKKQCVPQMITFLR